MRTDGVARLYNANGDVRAGANEIKVSAMEAARGGESVALVTSLESTGLPRITE